MLFISRDDEREVCLDAQTPAGLLWTSTDKVQWTSKPISYLLSLSDSEVQVKIAEQRALKAEEDLQAALERIKDLERQLQGRPSLEPSNKEGKDQPTNARRRQQHRV